MMDHDSYLFLTGDVRPNKPHMPFHNLPMLLHPFVVLEWPETKTFRSITSLMPRHSRLRVVTRPVPLTHHAKRYGSLPQRRVLVAPNGTKRQGL